MKLLDAAQSRELDRLSQRKYGIRSFDLMTRAGAAVAAAVLGRWPVEARRADVIIVAGKGNNGGDGFVAARRLIADGVAARVILLAETAALKGDAARACGEFRAAGGRVIESVTEAQLKSAFGERPAGVVIDAIFGTGLNAEVRGLARRAIELVNSAGVPIASVDIASGVNSDSGAVMGAAVRASLSVTFGVAKYGHVSYPGAAHCGELEIAEIGFAPEAVAEVGSHGRFFEDADARALLKPRAPDSHKGGNGHVLVIAGSRGKSGAAVLASRGALRTGAGLVTAAIPESIAAIVAGAQAELMTEPLADSGGAFDGARATAMLAAIIDSINAIAAGPGIGQSEGARAVVEWLIDEASAPRRPILFDADALNLIAKLGVDRLRRARGPVVLTPHPGEMARLVESTAAAVNTDRIGAARGLAGRTGASVLLKGARTVIAAPDGRIAVNSTGNPGMGTGGMGDVLSGIVGALMGQGIEPFDALSLGAFLHGRAADLLAARVGRIGYLAGDVADEMPRALASVSS
ncbi:MAG TPA: NAD(P)H-hydrate dehydratase [Candidatus Binataceae bacterium]|nr:NAD(P)H-hydrate dehydratase [Candidatus Binataceae bacterium]